MKILYISDSAIPSKSANSIHVMKMCSAFANYNHDVTLLAKNTKSVINNIKNIFKFYDVKKDFQVKIFPNKSFKGSGRLYNLFLPFLMKNNFDLYYTRAIYPALWLSLMNKKFFFEIHEPFDSKNRFLKFLFSLIIKLGKVQKWVVISHALKRYLIDSHSIDSEKIFVAPDGADEIILEKYSHLNLIGDFKVGYVGSLFKGKGLEILIPLSLEMPTVDFHIVGGKDVDIVDWKNKISKTQKNIHFHGFVPHSKTPQYMKSFDVLIAPYQSAVHVKKDNLSNNIALWMSPLKVFEYMSSKKPFITSDIPILKEILTDGDNCILCNPAKINDWKNAIENLREDETLRNRISDNAYNNFIDKYTWKQRSINLINEFKKIKN